MSLASKVISDARYTLADSNADRWTDERLLSLLNDGLIQLLIDTELQEDHSFALLQDGVQRYDVSAIALRLTRVEWNGKSLPLVTHHEMDKIDPGWNEFTQGGDPTHIVYDKLDGGQFKVYPIPGNVITYAKSTSPYGIITGVYDADSIVTATEFGLDTSAVLTDYLNLFYVVRPAPVTLTDQLPLSEVWDEALQHYIVGRALRDNMDTQSRSMAQEELAGYSAIVAKMIRLTSKSSVKRTTRTTSYNGGI